jgi:triacylglycerol lipase
MKTQVKKWYLLVLAVLLSTSLFAGSSSKPFDNQDGFVLGHGILGFDDNDGKFLNLVKYWGGMDDYLRSQGALVITPGKTAMEGLGPRAQQQKEDILVWMAANNLSKVHVIGHSQGGLDARYMIANLNMANKIATLTTLNSVHRGTPVADIGLGVIPDWLEPFVGVVVNAFGKLIYGEGDQDVIEMATSLTTYAMAAFNASTPNVSGVKYFSYGSKITSLIPATPNLIQHPIMGLLYPVTYIGGAFNGQGAANDGVVPISSQKWGTWKGEPGDFYHSFLTEGIDHLQATNFEWTGQTWYDVEGYYLSMAKNAKLNQ